MICPACGHDNVPGTDACSRCMTDLAPLDRPVGHDPVERSLMHDPVHTLTQRPPVCVPLGSRIGDALELMLRERIGAVLVTDAGRLHGILTERDVLTQVALIPDFADLLVDEFMSADPETVSPTDTLAVALRKMDVGGYRHLPVVRDGSPVAILSVKDLITHLTDLCERP